MKSKSSIALLAILCGLLMTACGANEPEPTPTLSFDDVRTQAVSTFADALTLTALANPTSTSTPTPSATPFVLNTLPPAGTPPAGFPTAAGAGLTTPGCNKLVYVRDVTVPDNTVMQPGKSFTKTWLVQNQGTCSWAAGFKFSLVGGEAMGGSTLTLSSPVQSGAQIELSVAMTAPQTAGTYTGMWRMADAGGVYFGDQLTVVIQVGAANPTSPAATAAPSATPTQ